MFFTPVNLFISDFILTYFYYKLNCRVKDVDQSMKSSSALDVENLHGIPTISNLSDVYSNEKFGHDLLQFIGMFNPCSGLVVLYFIAGKNIPKVHNAISAKA